MTIVMKALSELKPNPNNPRTIKDEQYKKLVKSLKDFPEMTSVRPVIVNTEGIILGGNMRYKAAQEAGWKEIPVIEVDWSEAKQKEFIIKDNVSGGEWDWDMLANEWNEEELQNWGIDLPTDWGDEAILTDEPQTKDLYAVVVVAFDDFNDLDKITSLYQLDSMDITEDIKEKISGQRKVYVFKK